MLWRPLGRNACEFDACQSTARLKALRSSLELGASQGKRPLQGRGFVGLALGWVVRSDGVAGVQQLHADSVSHLGLGLDAHDFGDEFQIQRTK